MVFLADSTDLEYLRRAVGPVVEKLCRGMKSQSYGRPAFHPSTNSVGSPARRASGRQPTHRGQAAPDVFTLSYCLNPGLFSQDENLGASIYGDRRVPTLGRMMVTTEL